MSHSKFWIDLNTFLNAIRSLIVIGATRLGRSNWLLTIPRRFLGANIVLSIVRKFSLVTVIVVFASLLTNATQN